MFSRSRTRDRDESTQAVDDTDTRDGRTTRAAYEEGYADGRDPVAAQDVRKERFGGLNPGAAFFGWLVAIAVERAADRHHRRDRRGRRQQHARSPSPRPRPRPAPSASPPPSCSSSC